MQNTKTVNGENGENGIIKNEKVYGINQSAKQTKYTRLIMNSVQRKLEQYVIFASDLANKTDGLFTMYQDDLIDLKKMLNLYIQNDKTISMENYYGIMQRFETDGTGIKNIFEYESQLFKNVDKISINEDSFTQVFNLHHNVNNLKKSCNDEINLCENLLSKQKIETKSVDRFLKQMESQIYEKNF